MWTSLKIFWVDKSSSIKSRFDQLGGEELTLTILNTFGMNWIVSQIFSSNIRLHKCSLGCMGNFIDTLENLLESHPRRMEAVIATKDGFKMGSTASTYRCPQVDYIINV